MLHFTASEAKRIGLSFEGNLSSGYVAGGPWITKELSMQRMTASDTIVRGGEKFRGKLPLPNKAKVWNVAVLAFPINRSEWESSLTRPPKVSCSLPQLNAQNFIRTDVKLVDIPPQPKGKSVYVTLDFGENFTARSISYKVRQRGKATTGAMNVPGPSSEEFYGSSYIKQPDLGTLEVSADGVNFSKICLGISNKGILHILLVFSLGLRIQYSPLLSQKIYSPAHGVFVKSEHEPCQYNDSIPETVGLYPQHILFCYFTYEHLHSA